MTAPTTRAVTVITLAPEPRSSAAARHFVRDFLADAGFGGSVVFPAVLATSELVTNAVLHAGTAVDLRIEIAGPKLRVEVVDYGGGCPVHERVSFDADHGHGLMVVARVATRWRSRPGVRPQVGAGSSRRDRA